MRNFRLDLSFDGSRYRGWQKLGDAENTIQGKLEETLSRLLDEEITLVGCGRTDAGVHARQYTASFKTESDIESDELLKQLRHYLPEDIAVNAVSAVPPQFQARYRVRSKTYVYRIDTREQCDVFQRRFAFHFPCDPDLDAMREAARVLCGTHDFQSFTRLKPGKKKTERTVLSINVQNQDGMLTIAIRADGFLWNMVRILAGTLLDAGIGKCTAKDVERMLAAKERAKAGAMLPAKGLFLWEVEY